MPEILGEWVTSWPFGAFLFLLGLCVGSFLNVCIHRLPTGQSIVRPASHCTSCQALIAWYDNIPVASYLILGGRCRRCGEPFSARYMVVELATGLIFAGYWAAYFKTGLRPEAAHGGVYAVHMVLAAALVVSGVIDLERKEIYISVTNLALAVAVAGSFLWPEVQKAGAYDHAFAPWVGWDRADAVLRALVGAAVGSGLILLVRAGGTVAFGREAMGIGDAYLMAAVGAALGWEATVLVFFLAPFAALAYVFAAAVGRAACGQAEGKKSAAPAGRKTPIAPVVGMVLGFAALLTAAAGTYRHWAIPVMPILAVSLLLFLTSYWLWRRQGPAEAEAEAEEAPAARPTVAWLPVAGTAVALAGLAAVGLATGAGWMASARVLLAASLALAGLAFWLTSREEKQSAAQSEEAETEPEDSSGREVPYGPFLGLAAGLVMLFEGAIIGHLRPGVEGVARLVWDAVAR
jgi:leader peptidase (prepilin peptidase)/N-methyltransferase